MCRHLTSRLGRRASYLLLGVAALAGRETGGQSTGFSAYLVSHRFEWTPVDGVDSYSVSVETEIEIPIFEQDGIKETSITLPKGTKLDSGTYLWRVVGMKGDRSVADSGRAAFVVLEP